MAIQQSVYRGLRELALFAGAGGGILGGHLLGWRTVCAVERDAYAAAVLAQRQNDGCLEAFPIWSDMETFDGRPWRGIVDVISGGFPCTDISCAGKGAGIDGEESGLWREFARIIGEVGPRYVLVENSPMLTVRGLGRVLGDLAALGYDAEWGVLSAADAIWFECLSRDDRPALDHLRERIWIVARNASSEKIPNALLKRDCGRRTENAPENDEIRSRGKRSASETIDGSDAAGTDAALGRLAVLWWAPRDAGYAGGVYEDGNAANERCEGLGTDREQEPSSHGGQAIPLRPSENRGWWAVEPGVGRLVHGLADRVDRCKALGNGQVPAVVRLAWNILKEISRE